MVGFYTMYLLEKKKKKKKRPNIQQMFVAMDFAVWTFSAVATVTNARRAKHLSKARAHVFASYFN